MIYMEANMQFQVGDTVIPRGADLDPEVPEMKVSGIDGYRVRCTWQPNYASPQTDDEWFDNDDLDLVAQ